MKSPHDFAAEVVSNRYLTEEAAHGAGEELRLRQLGWVDPKIDGCPNWRREGTSIVELIAIITTVPSVVFDVLRESPASSVFVRTFAVAH